MPLAQLQVLTVVLACSNQEKAQEEEQEIQKSKTKSVVFQRHPKLYQPE